MVSFFNLRSNPIIVPIHSSSTSHSNYIQVTPKGDTMYVWHDKIVDKKTYSKSLVERDTWNDVINSIVKWALIIVGGSIVLIILLVVFAYIFD